MIKLSIAWAAIVLIVSLTIVTAAKSATTSYGDPKLDGIATAIAGFPVGVSCGRNETDWADTERGVGFKFSVDGFTNVGVPEIYLAPRVCDTIEADLHEGVAAVGDYWNGLAIRAFVHEVMHQKLNSMDEALVECTAFKSVRKYAPLFGYKTSVVQTTYVHVAKTTTYRRVVKTVPNPALAHLVRWASFWHDLLPASYRAMC